ncbi:hypothetical protein [Hydrogenophaga crocea]|uniref:Uncharacterized protein n=1 Tax=Hydrogenophaga crocea TaxID=2716225 RepID=A0A6G8IE66_9BURK|nr:hypothetical protein [Hydrogenophaga crocea]QIM51452.1 hypothetical protein G9Q37_04525 [Hydrogenophaga crocea]
MDASDYVATTLMATAVASYLTDLFRFRKATRRSWLCLLLTMCFLSTTKLMQSGWAITLGTASSVGSTVCFFFSAFAHFRSENKPEKKP